VAFNAEPKMMDEIYAEGMEGIMGTGTQLSLNGSITVGHGISVGQTKLPKGSGAKLVEDTPARTGSRGNMGTDFQYPKSSEVDRSVVFPMHAATAFEPMQPANGVRTPSRGWKKRARPVYQELKRDVANCPEQGS
jgi:hypothetical protein